MIISTGVPWAVLLGALVPLVALIVLFAADIPIGQPHLIYRYSPWWVVRAVSTLPALLIGIAAAWALYRGLGARGPRRYAFASAAVAGYVLLTAWTFFAPPNYVNQHVFNMESPSHEGAFAAEARGIQSVRSYVSETFYQRLKLEPEDMKGRRVLSNPPGVTVFSVLCDRALDAAPAVRNAIVHGFSLEETEDAEKTRHFSTSIALGILLTLLWGLALAFAYRLFRLFLPPMAAAALAFASVFNPSTVTFTPGKDPAQMLTVLALVWAWMSAYQHKKLGAGLATGVIFGFSLMVGPYPHLDTRNRGPVPPCSIRSSAEAAERKTSLAHLLCAADHRRMSVRFSDRVPSARLEHSSYDLADRSAIRAHPTERHRGPILLDAGGATHVPAVCGTDVLGAAHRDAPRYE